MPPPIETMRTGRQDLFGLILIENRHIFGNHHLGQILVAGTPGDITVAVFFFAENGKIHIGFLQHPGHGPAVDQQVMQAPQQPVPFVLQPDQRRAGNAQQPAAAEAQRGQRQQRQVPGAFDGAGEFSLMLGTYTGLTPGPVAAEMRLWNPKPPNARLSPTGFWPGCSA